MEFEALLKKEFDLLDGAMGTQLQRKGLPAGAIPELANLEHPEWLLDIHRAYVNAGSDIIYANTFGANRDKLARTDYTVEQVVSAGVRLARQAAGDRALVALDIGPLGKLLEPNGMLPFEDAVERFGEVVEAGARRILWRPEKDWPNVRLGKDVVFTAKVTAWAENTPPDYMVIRIDDAVQELPAEQRTTYYETAEALPFPGGEESPGTAAFSIGAPVKAILGKLRQRPQTIDSEAP